MEKITNIDQSTIIPKGRNNFDRSELVSNFWGNLEWRKVHAAMSLSQFDGSADWLTSELGISYDLVMESLNGLVELGVVDKENSSFSCKEVFEFNKEELDKNPLLKGHKLLCTQQINSLNIDNIKSGKAWFISANDDLISEFRVKLNALFDELIKKSNDEPVKDKLYMLTCNVNELTKTSETEER